MAQGFLEQFLDDVGADAEVESAGTLGWSGRPATPEAVEVMAERGIDIGAHRSRRLTTATVAEADLVIAMTRAHAWATTARSESKLDVTFLPGELNRLARKAGPRSDEEPLDEWVARLAEPRPNDRPIGHASDEIDDPVGERIDVYRCVADRLERDLAVFAPYLAPR